MSSTTELSTFDERDFRAIEAAVLETEKGRWFLNEFGRRNRVADTQTLLGALSRLERNLTSQDVPEPKEHPDIAALSSAIEETRKDIGAVRNDMLKDCAEVPADKAVFSFLSENAHQISVDLIATAEALQGTVNTLRTGDGASHADTIDGHVHNLFDGGWRQDVLAQRISKAMGLLEHLDQNLKALAGKPAAALSMEEISRSLPTALSPENLKFFDGDDDMFTSGDSPGEPEPAKLNLEILKADPQEAETGEPSAVQPADDTPQDVVKAITEPDPVVSEAPETPETPEIPDSVQQEAEPAPAPEAVIDVAPVEPNIVIIRRGKGTASDEAAAENAQPESNTEDAPATSSNTEEKPAEAVSAQQPDEASEPVQSETAAADQTADTPQEAAPASPETNESEQAAGRDATDSNASNVLANMDLDTPETPSSGSEFSAEDSLNAFAEMAASPDINDADETVPEAKQDTPETNQASSDDVADDKERIVVIRRSTSEEAEIPFADYLGVEPQPEPQTNSSSGS